MTEPEPFASMRARAERFTEAHRPALTHMRRLTPETTAYLNRLAKKSADATEALNRALAEADR